MLKAITPNIILIIWESGSAKALEGYRGREVMPYLALLKKEGIYFNNVYASGDRTDKGLSAILSGYPALPASSIIRLPNKASRLEVLPRLFRARNYSTPFYYGGETEFANIKSYLLHGGAEPIIDKNEFSTKDQNSKWGAHDGVVAKKILSDLKGQKQPYFITWLTLSSHEPYEIPEPPLFPENDYTSKFLSSLHYTDKVIFDFISTCKQQPWWSNTVVIIIADHGHPLPETDRKINNFKIPMLWLGGALQKTDTIINKVISQTDLATTLTRQLGFDRNHFPFSKDIFASHSEEWSLFRFKDGFGFVTASQYYVFDNIGKQIIESNGAVLENDLKAGKALQQTYYDDFLKK
jgi:phosphoglycerol transferase MdoB-like AlkP superfamily enzyme